MTSKPHIPPGDQSSINMIIKKNCIISSNISVVIYNKWWAWKKGKEWKYMWENLTESGHLEDKDGSIKLKFILTKQSVQ